MQDRVHPPNNTNYYLSKLNYGSKLTLEFILEKRFKNVPRKKKDRGSVDQISLDQNCHFSLDRKF